MSSTYVVGVADCILTGEAGATLVTYALGSCIAVAVHEQGALVAGLLHFMLPEPSADSKKADQNPWMFASTGVPLLLARAAEMGANRRKMSVRLIGGAQVLDDDGYFNIGRKNHVAVRKVLWREGVLVEAEAVGGTESRTVWLEVATGKLRIRRGARPPEELPTTYKGVRECLSAS